MASVTQQTALGVQADVPVILVGEPGTAKTAASSQLGGLLGFPQFGGAWVVSAAYLLPEDVGGVLVPANGGSGERIHDDWVQAACETPTLLVIDEFTRATSQAALNAWLRVLQERAFGPRRLHPLTRMVLTANPVDTDPGVRPAPTAAANRLWWLRFSAVDVQPAWLDWMRGGPGLLGQIPVTDAWRATMAPWREQAEAAREAAERVGRPAEDVQKARALVAGFLHVNRALCHDLPRLPGKGGNAGQIDPVKAAGPWPSFRSWTNGAAAWAVGQELGSFDAGLEGMSACVGEGPALQFGAFVRDMDLGDPEDALAHPDTFPLPKRSDRVGVLLDSLAAIALNRMAAGGQAAVAAFHAFQELVLRAAPEHKDIAADTMGRVLGGKIPAGVKFDARIGKEFGPMLRAIGFLK